MINTLVAAGSLSLAAVASGVVPVTGPIVNPANNHAYYLLGSDYYFQSEAQAQVLGGHLATINDAAENAWVVSTFLNYGGLSRDLWIGLDDVDTEGAFQWKSGQPFVYSNWAPGQPDNGAGISEQDKVHIYGGAAVDHLQGWQPGQWNDIGNVTSYTTISGSIRQIYGVVEVVQSVPEPSSSLLLVGAGSALAWFRRRNQKPAV